MSLPARMSATRLVVAVFVAMFALAALAACQPTTPQPPDAASTDAVAPATAAVADASAPAPSKLAEAAASLNPLASPKDEIIAAMRRFMAVDSYHASMQITGGLQGEITNEIDFVAPDRFRMAMAGVGTQTIIGDSLYMDMQGRTIKTALPKGTLGQWRDPARLDENEATMTVQAQGSNSSDGVATDKYLVHHTRPQPSDVTIWIGEEGLPVQMQVDGTAQNQATRTTIRYSRFNDPAMKIEPPQ